MKLSLTGAEWWRKELAARGHFIDLHTANELYCWWNLKSVLILQSEPGGGKSSLLQRAAEVLGASIHWLQCYGEIAPDSVLYRWNTTAQKMQAKRAEQEGNDFDWFHRRFIIPGTLARALLDPAEVVIAVLDEVDKLRVDSQTENCVLEFCNSQTITVNESRDVIKRPEGLPPIAIAFTSNAGLGQPRESLSFPLLRRGVVVDFPPLSQAQVYEVLSSAVPELSESLRGEIAKFIHGLRKEVWEKPISLSEVIAWGQRLRLLEVTALDENVIALTASSLAKGIQERESLRLATPKLIKSLHNWRTSA